MFLPRLLRSLGALFIVALTSFSMVATANPAAAVPDWADPGAARTVARQAAAAGTRTALPRLIACATPVSCAIMAGGTAAVMGGSYWLTETESGKDFSADVLDFFGLDAFADSWLGERSNRSADCSTTVEPVAWSQHQVSLSMTMVGARKATGEACTSAFARNLANVHQAVSLEADCVRPNGELYKNAFNWGPTFDGLFTACNIAAEDWLIGVRTIDPVGASNVQLTNPGYYKNPVWNGLPGAPADWWTKNVDKPQTTATIRCRAADGSTYTKSVTVAGVVDPALACDATGSLIARTVDVLRNAGTLRQRLYDVGITPEGIAEYPECFTGGAYCDMAVTIDGALCTSTNPDCVNWWDFAQQNPERVSCVFGPYTLGYGDCRELRNAYVTPDGAWTPPDLPSDAVPIPYYPTNPDYRPAPPTGNAGDPSWLRPEDCPPVSTSVSQYGLQPIAVQGLRCFLADHPDFTFTSGHRSYQHFGQVSDHPHGLALDLAPPAWDTPAGNQRGWDAVAYWIWNSEPLGVRYLIFDGAIWWPDSGWHVYVDPDGNTDPHRDHVHVSLDPLSSPDLYRPPTTAPNLPYPQPTPDPEVKPPTNPQPPTNPNPDPNPEPNPNPPGWPEADGPNCDGSAVTWNPKSWVVVPLRCAFMPSPEVLTEVQTELTDASTKTGVPVWFDTVGEIPPLLDVDTSPVSCKGPAMNLPPPLDIDLYLFEACEGPMKTMAGYTKTFMTLSLVVGTALTVTTLISRGFGYDASTGGTRA